MVGRRLTRMANESEEKRRRLLQAAREVAVSKGGPSSSVHVHEVAKVMGLKDPIRDEGVRAELTSMIQDLQEQGDVEGWSSTNGRFRLTSQGASEVEDK
jgi:hypothetical protein